MQILKKVQAPTLAEAYQKAADELECSVTDLQTEVVQHPSKGVLGLFKKEAVIVAVCGTKSVPNTADAGCKSSEIDQGEDEEESFEEKAQVEAYIDQGESEEDADGVHDYHLVEENGIVTDFFHDEEEESEDEELFEEESIVYSELAQLIETEIKGLMERSCFDIDVVEVDVRDDTALIFIDGEDAALLIGKEGHRYNAFSYLLFHWLHSKYELYVKLEIAAFLTGQQEMIRHTLEDVVSHVQTHGKGRTRFLDGILVQLALEYLREVFPDKYVAVKTSKNGKKFIVINDFNKK